ncbi:MAG: T9SS type A sorting domain-containing protein [Bacteroidetes bacterium]|nr:T9SS type A sorting domain-containing protein [Bacteroidota bacterium]
MKTNLISALIFLVASICGYSQVWQQTSSTPEGSGVTEMVVRQINGHIFVTTGSFKGPNGDMGGVRRSTDDGATWENLNDVFIARTIIDAPDGDLYASLWDFPQAEGLYRSTDNGNSWGTPLVTVPNGDNIFSIAVNTLTTPNTIFAGTRNGPLRSTDNGVNWAPATNGIPGNSWVRDIDVDSAGVVVAATTNGLFFSIDNGDLWEETTGIAQGDTIVKLIFDYPLSTEKAGGSTRLLGGSDDGNIYEAFRDVNNRYLFSTLLAIFPGSELSGMAIAYLRDQNKKMHGVSTFPEGSFGGGFYLSSDDGASWNQNNSGLPSNPLSSAFSGSVKESGGSTADVQFYIGFFENMNGGARIFKITYIVTDIELVSSLVPDDYELQQNYPNPFNPSTSIEYSIPSGSFVELKVYDVLGNEVASLVNEQQQAGVYRADFTAVNLSSGMYFARITANEFTQVVKMILLK